MFAFEKKSKGDAWRKLPVTHVLTQQDYSVPRPCQDLMLEKVRNKCVVAKTENYETCHSVFIQQDEMTRAVLAAA